MRLHESLYSMKGFLTYEQVAEYFSISVSFIKKKISDGSFRLNQHYFKPDGQNGIIRFDAVEVEKWMRGKETTHEALQQGRDSVSDILSRLRPSSQELRVA